jgi:predicted aldo/keto reductase-like oxidoreductase
MSIKRRDFLKFAAAGAALSLMPVPATAAVVNGMPYRELGATGEKVSLLCLGGAHIGGKELSSDESVAMIRHAIDEGVNFLDNAWHYHGGESERRMGRALKDGYRDKALLMTKHQGRDGAAAQAFLEESLRRLDVDVIDLWQFHEVNEPDFPERIYTEGALEYALKARDEGKIRYIGFTGHHIPVFLAEMIERGYAWDTCQFPVNVFDHHFESFTQQVLPKAVEKKIGVIGMKTQGGSPGNISNKAGACTPAECLRFAMMQPVSTVCSGMDSMEVLVENIATAKSFKPFEKEELDQLLTRAKEQAMTGEFEPYKTAWHRDVRKAWEARQQAAGA